jgi:hypothetical protein
MNFYFQNDPKNLPLFFKAEKSFNTQRHFNFTHSRIQYLFPGFLHSGDLGNAGPYSMFPEYGYVSSSGKYQIC